MRLRSLTQKAATVLFGQITDWTLIQLITPHPTVSASKRPKGRVEPPAPELFGWNTMELFGWNTIRDLRCA